MLTNQEGPGEAAKDEGIKSPVNLNARSDIWRGESPPSSVLEIDKRRPFKRDNKLRRRRAQKPD